jgi:hypothetical protein
VKPRKLPTLAEIWNVTWASVVAVLAVEHVFVGPLWQRVFAAAALVSMIAFGSTFVLAFVTIWRNARKPTDLPFRDLRVKGDPAPGGSESAAGGPVQIAAGDRDHAHARPEPDGSITLTAGMGVGSDPKGGTLVLQGGNSMPNAQPNAQGGEITLTPGKLH